MSEEETRAKAKRHRSRNYPVFDLGEAIQQARTVHAKEGSAWVPFSVACSHMGLSEKSSTGMRAISALIQFGLLDDEGHGKNRRVRVSAVARQILHPEDSIEKSQAIRTAATKPVIFQELWQKYGDRLPSDQTLGWELVESGDFSKGSVDQFIVTYKSTIEFAGLNGTPILNEEGDDSHDDSDDSQAEPPSRSAPTSQGNKPMAATNAAPGRTDFDLPIYLSSGQAILRMPVPMTPRDFETLKGALSATLDGLKAAFVREDPKPVEEVQE